MEAHHYLNMNPDDDQLWSLGSVTLTDAAAGGGVKFRANTAWTVNWGAADFPSGVGTQDGANILCVAGTYNISFNSETGEYLFSDPTGTEEILSPSAVKVYPNPASQTLTIDLQELNVSGQASMRIFDMQGRVLRQTNVNVSGILSIDISDLNAGNYLLNLSNGEFTVGKRFSVAR